MFTLRRVATAPEGAAAPFPATVCLLPASIDAEGGIYSPFSATMASALRRRGVDAALAHTDDQCEIRERLFGELVTEFTIGFAASVAGSAAWAGLVAALRLALEDVAKSEPTAHVRIVTQKQMPDGATDNVYFEFDGPLGELAEALTELSLTEVDDGATVRDRESERRRVDEPRET